MGSSDASATCLRAILREETLEVAGVVTQPDRPAGRGRALTPCPCRAFAAAHGIRETIAPQDVNSPAALERIAAWRPDAIAVVAFGQFLKAPLLALPRFGCLNCHFSLLPKYRGASPVAAAIAAGDRMTGVTVMRMGPGMDDGPVLLQSYEPIYSDATGGELMEGLAVAGGVALAKVLRLAAAGMLPREVPQNAAEATYAGKLKKSDGLVRWASPALAIERMVRAYDPWPGCHAFLPERFRKRGGSGRVTILKAELWPEMDPGWRDAAPGTVLKCVMSRQKGSATQATGPVIKCGDTALLLAALKPEGGSAMDGKSFLMGRRLEVGADRLLEA